MKTKSVKCFPFIPTGDNLVLLADEEQEKSAGGIIIPDAAKRPLTQGTVIACGEHVGQYSGKEKKIKIGDSVIFGLHTDSSIRIDGQLYLVVKEENVLAFQPCED